MPVLPPVEADGEIEEIVMEEIVLDGEVATPSHDEIRAEMGFDEASIEEISMETPEIEEISMESISLESGDAFDNAGVDAQAALEASLLEAERLESERLEAEQRLQALETAERLEAERIAYEREEAERAEAERVEAERAEAERVEAERVEAERVEAERVEAERVEAERVEAERVEAERVEAERVEAERVEAERVEAERVEAERLEAERLEAERVEAERAEAERVEAARLEAERIAAEEEAEYARIEAEEAAQRQARERAAAEAAQPIAPVEAPAVEAESEPAVAQMLADAMAGHGDPDEALDLTDLDPELVDIFCEEGGDLLDHSDGLLAQLREGPTSANHWSACSATCTRSRAVRAWPASWPWANSATRWNRCSRRWSNSAANSAATASRARTRLRPPACDGHPRRRAPRDRDAGCVDRRVRRASRRPHRTKPERNRRTRRPAHSCRRSSSSRCRRRWMQPAPTTTMTSVRAPQEQVRIRADLLDRLVNYAGEVAIYRCRLEQQLGAFRGAMGEMEQTNARLRDQLRRLDIETEAQIIARYQREDDGGRRSFDPLELDRFSNLQQLSRGLAESATDLTSLQGALDDLTRQYETLLLQQSRVSSELQEGLMRTRMVPFDALVPRLRRVVRQAASDTGKQVQLKVEGAQGEMDRNVLERMTAPLEHMLRNAVAHGLESPDERRKAKKPEEGTVRIAVRREGSEVVLEVSDDGAGLNRDAIRKRAEERGLIAADAELSDSDLDALILEPGFSTADTVSRLAGRGVGMDVVYSEVRQLGGSLDIRVGRAKARSSRSACRRRWRSPRRCSSRSARPRSRCRSPRCAASAASAANSWLAADATYRYAGEDYALHDLGTLIGHARRRPKDSCRCRCCSSAPATCARRSASTRCSATAKSWSSRSARRSNSVPGIFGATIMGDGRVVVILDVAPLVRRQAARLPRDATRRRRSRARRVPLVMVVDDSITMRKVTGRVLERHNIEVATAKDGVDALEKHGRARARPDAARYRDAAHGRLRTGDGDEGRPAPAQRADHHDHLAYRREASPARVRHRRRPLPRQAVPGARIAAQRVRTAGTGPCQ